jgi:hypothetical protein
LRIAVDQCDLVAPAGQCGGGADSNRGFADTALALGDRDDSPDRSRKVHADATITISHFLAKTFASTTTS